MDKSANQRISKPKKRKVIDPNDGITAEELSEAGRVLQAREQTSESANQQIPPAPEENFSAERLLEGEKPYTLGTWAGRMQWKCKLCPWDTLKGEAEILKHIASKHAPPRPRVYVANKSGREIKA